MDFEDREEDSRLDQEHMASRKDALLSPTSPGPTSLRGTGSDADLDDAERKRKKKRSSKDNKKKKDKKKEKSDREKTSSSASAGEKDTDDDYEAANNKTDIPDAGDADDRRSSSKKSKKKKKKDKKEKSKKSSSRKSKHHDGDDNDDDDNGDNEDAAKRHKKHRDKTKEASIDGSDGGSDMDRKAAGPSSKSKKNKSRKHRHRHAKTGSDEDIDDDADMEEVEDEETKGGSDGEAPPESRRHRHSRSHHHRHDKKSEKSSSKKKSESTSKRSKKKDGSSKHSSKKHHSSKNSGDCSEDELQMQSALRDASHEDSGFATRDTGFGALDRAVAKLSVESKTEPESGEEGAARSSSSGGAFVLEKDLEEHDLDDRAQPARQAPASSIAEDDADFDDGDAGSEGKHHESGGDNDDDDDVEGDDDEEAEQTAWNQSLPIPLRNDLYVDEFSDVQDASQEMSQRIRKLRKLLYSPVPEGVTLRAQIDRHYDHSGSVYYSFILPVERGDGMRDKRMTLMIAKCRTGVTLKPTFVISLEPIDFKKRCAQRSERYFGKVQLIKGSDALGLSGPMQYAIYDDGYNPNRVGGMRGEPPVGFARKLLASVIYEDTKGTPEDLKMSVALPKMSRVPEEEVESSIDPLKTQFKTLTRCHNFSIQERLMEDEEDLEHHPFLHAAENTFLATRSIPMGNKKRLAISSESRFPVAPSIKNFEVCRAPVSASSDPELGLARIGKERFFVLARYPFSPFEAFGVCISKFDASSSYRSKLGRRMSL